MSPEYIQKLKQPCKNRGLYLVDCGNGQVVINGIRFETMRECEEYISKFERTDFKREQMTEQDIKRNAFKLKLEESKSADKEVFRRIAELTLEDQTPGPFHIINPDQANIDKTNEALWEDYMDDAMSHEEFIGN